MRGPPPCAERVGSRRSGTLSQTLTFSVGTAVLTFVTGLTTPPASRGRGAILTAVVGRCLGLKGQTF